MNVPSAVGYPAVIKVTKAASPFSLAASKAASIRPPNPRSISATAMGPVEDATPSCVLDVKGAVAKEVVGVTTRPNVEVVLVVDGLGNVEKAMAEDAMQPNQRENETRRIIFKKFFF